ncbi:hypothetical protein PF005_g28961 [Phytophthora fragariae]|uniref:Uncharacterized protein n=1 Tax=Phytophthora fragariae TaxID=53985 RepID=A0A6A3UBV4_9STRA|nr:hypothetical protein PF003_g13673 [Phytophthora fragariae]KAE8930471.1 hypothetical protein PF009_g19434 [Phytophthora fragariae]KAE8966168.1 hypothetical protein PF011_g28036 [Phytophthora fragariae]KAE9065043.1 hypothetical protein PF010_g28372 [Phytophthora fragariae]KAE9065471.1 hypothetical protein PF007_g28831 [Phytophthora fragariae]
MHLCCCAVATSPSRGDRHSLSCPRYRAFRAHTRRNQSLGCGRRVPEGVQAR